MHKDDINIISEYQIPKINMVAKEILADPTIFLERLDNLNNLNSLSILSLHESPNDKYRYSNN